MVILFEILSVDSSNNKPLENEVPTCNFYLIRVIYYDDEMANGINPPHLETRLFVLLYSV